MLTDCQNIILLAQLLARIVLMSFVSIGAILSIYWGWKLYKDSVNSVVSGEIQIPKMNVKFIAAGPGVVLAAFGAWLLSLVATHPFGFQKEVTKQMLPTAYYSSSDGVSHANLTHVQFRQVVQETTSPKKAGIASKTSDCKCQPFKFTESVIVHNMPGASKEPTNSEVLRSLEIALAAVRASSSSANSTNLETIRSLETLEYLKELAVYEVKSDLPRNSDGEEK